MARIKNTTFKEFLLKLTIVESIHNQFTKNQIKNTKHF